MAVTVHPDYEYSAFENGDEVYIVASELLEAVAEKCDLGERNEAGNAVKSNVIARFRWREIGSS